VNRQVGFGDDDDAADAERVELVEDDIDDGGLCPLRRFNESALHSLETVDGIGSAIKQLEKQVSSQGVHSGDPPFGDSTIYRTSPGSANRATFSRPLAALARDDHGRGKFFLLE
jgi:hypothetical protein